MTYKVTHLVPTHLRHVAAIQVLTNIYSQVNKVNCMDKHISFRCSVNNLL